MTAGAFDCVVVGGGHAGAEAAWAASRLGARTVLVTMSRETIAKMSCNPAIGGLAKGQIVREIDALGGLMGEAIDATGIQFRTLNRSKGPAVQSPRAQADKYEYKDWVRRRLESAEGLTIIEGMAAEVVVENGAVAGVLLADGRRLSASAVILTTGTFLRGILHCGDQQWPGGRLEEPASNELSDCLRRLGLTVGRLKTGTPARLAGDTIDYGRLERQDGDEPAVPFSFLNDRIDRPQVPCWITYTNPQIHQLLRDNLHRAPMYSGQIQSVGPRYCPSIETKIVRFAEKERHQVFLEPEDRAGTTVYCNGISTSVPKDVQEQMIRLMAGTEKSRIVHYAYAIEYDYCPATQLKISLETKAVGGLYLAGQINGTSGYEEAAGQGFLAGINAVRKLNRQEPIVLGRDQAYLGVMIDDLLTREIDEPYRMFTSRAEYRLSLRSDNADARLTPIGRQIGLVDERRWRRFEANRAAMELLRAWLQATRTAGLSVWQRLQRPDDPEAADWRMHPEVAAMELSEEVIAAIVIEAKYEGYMGRQSRQIEDFRNLENIRLPEALDYAAVPHLRFEAREKLSTHRPHNLGQAGRIGGITPADLMVLQIHLKKWHGQRTAGTDREPAK